MRWSYARAALVSAVALGCAAPPALAHHSFAMFDATKTVSLSGVVTTFTWGNPHTWIGLTTEENGATQAWGVECGSPNMMVRQGWKSSLIKPGDRISVVVHPMRDGTATGSLVRVTLADGRVLGPGGAPTLPRN